MATSPVYCAGSWFALAREYLFDLFTKNFFCDFPDRGSRKPFDYHEALGKLEFRDSFGLEMSYNFGQLNAHSRFAYDEQTTSLADYRIGDWY